VTGFIKVYPSWETVTEGGETRFNPDVAGSPVWLSIDRIVALEPLNACVVKVHIVPTPLQLNPTFYVDGTIDEVARQCLA